MVNIIVELSKYLMIILMTSYTFLCFSIFGYQDPDKKKSLLRQQNVLMFMIHIIAYLVMYLEQEDVKASCILSNAGSTVWSYYIAIYDYLSESVRLVVNNMCMLLCIGMIMLTRLSYSNAVKQFVIAARWCGNQSGSTSHDPKGEKAFGMEKGLCNYWYCISGSCRCNWFCVLWSKAWFQVAGINVQPSELVKIVFVFFVASSFKQSMAFKDIVVTTALAAFHVLILVASKDLGAALIIFVVYLVMLYVATRQPLYWRD